jgi:hypothetical protein
MWENWRVLANLSYGSRKREYRNDKCCESHIFDWPISAIEGGRENTGESHIYDMPI